MTELGIDCFFVSALLAACAIGRLAVCFGNCQAIDVDKRLSRIEELWKAGKTGDYYEEASKMANDITSTSGTHNENEAAVQLLESLLSKAALSSKTTTSDLFAMRKVASYLLSSANASAEDRRTNARMLSRYLGEMRKEIVQDYRPKRVTRNVAPPPGVPGAAGMDPMAIRDPAARAQYLAAIRQNQENNLTNSRQATLRNVDSQMAKPILAYMIRAFKALGGRHSDFVAQCIKDARLTDEEQNELREEVPQRAHERGPGGLEGKK